MIADGMEDGEAVYDAMAELHPAAPVIMPPQATAIPSVTKTTQRGRHFEATNKAWAHGLATQFGLHPPGLGRNRGVPPQDHRRPASSQPASAQSAD